MKTQQFVITIEYGEKDDCGNPIPTKSAREIRCAIQAYIDASSITVDEITKSNRGKKPCPIPKNHHKNERR